MCCNTHQDRDDTDSANGVMFTLAESDDVRCMCKIGIPCLRRATGEDFPCTWCRDTDHMKACGEQRWQQRYAAYTSPDEFRNQYLTESGEAESQASRA